MRLWSDSIDKPVKDYVETVGEIENICCIILYRHWALHTVLSADDISMKYLISHELIPYFLGWKNQPKKTVDVE